MILGLVAAKSNSIRFPGKNKHMYNGKPLFWYSVETLLDSNVDDVYVITNNDNTFRVDCVPDENTTQDIVGFCNVMHSTYYYGPSCDQECILDTTMQSIQ